MTKELKSRALETKTEVETEEESSVETEPQKPYSEEETLHYHEEPTDPESYNDDEDEKDKDWANASVEESTEDEGKEDEEDQLNGNEIRVDPDQPLELQPKFIVFFIGSLLVSSPCFALTAKRLSHLLKLRSMELWSP